MYCCFNKSPRTLSESIYDFINKNGIGSTAFKGARRPFDHYRPTESAWYIIPSAELPFFRFGKFYFEWENPQRINCGVICTKGLAAELAVVYPSKKGRRLIMENDGWAFPEWAFCCFNNKLMPALREIKNNLPEIDLKIRLHGSYVDDPGLFDPYTEEKKAFDRYELAVDPVNDVIKVSSAKRNAMNLKILNQVRNGESFGKAMKEIAADSFLWCDFFIGTSFEITEDENAALSVENIFSKFLQPLAFLVK